MFYVPNSFLESLLREDVPYGDATAEGLGISDRQGMIECYPKADGFVCGIDLAARLFEAVGLEVLLQEKNGTYPAGHTVLRVQGDAGRIHAAYKTAQNIMEYCSGIGNRVLSVLQPAREENPRVQVAVTRKHFPGTKILSLYSALSAGAVVHRAGLSESLLIFDQHRVFCRDFAADLAALKVKEPEKKVAVEVESPEEGLKYVRLGADIIQCERFSLQDLKDFSRAAKMLNPSLVINAAGGVNSANAREYAASGADVLVTSWVYFGKPFDIKMKISSVPEYR
jgi:molybdenum transport protein